jgi:hypothetical protein
MEIKTGNTKKDNSRKYLHLSEDLQISFSNLEKPTLYFELNFREHSIDFYKKLKYLILMTGNILITLNSANSTSVIEFIKFISRSQIELFLRRKYFFTKINLFYDLSLLDGENLDHKLESILFAGLEASHQAMLDQLYHNQSALLSSKNCTYTD